MDLSFEKSAEEANKIGDGREESNRVKSGTNGIGRVESIVVGEVEEIEDENRTYEVMEA